MSFTKAGQWGPDTLDRAGTGTPLPNTSVRVLNTDLTLATLYTDDTKATQASNPTTTDSLGNLTFFAAPGNYKLVAEVNGMDQAALDVEVQPDRDDLVHTAGAQTVAGVKTFTSAPVFPDDSITEAAIIGLPIFVNLNALGAQCNGRTMRAAATTSAGSAVVNVTGGSFTSEDVGKLVEIRGGGAQGGNHPFFSTIASVGGPTQITLAAAVTTSASGVDLTYGTDDTDVWNEALALITDSGAYERGIRIIWDGMSCVSDQLTLPRDPNGSVRYPGGYRGVSFIGNGRRRSMLRAFNVAAPVIIWADSDMSGSNEAQYARAEFSHCSIVNVASKGTCMKWVSTDIDTDRLYLVVDHVDLEYNGNFTDSAQIYCVDVLGLHYSQFNDVNIKGGSPGSGGKAAGWAGKFENCSELTFVNVRMASGTAGRGFHFVGGGGFSFIRCRLDGGSRQAPTNATSVAGTSITNGATALTAASGFSSGMVGRKIYVPGAGSGGAHLDTYVAAFVGAGEVTLGNAASATVAGQTALLSGNTVGSCSATGTSLTTTTGLFTSDYVGRLVRIPNAGANDADGNPTTQIALISAFVDSNTLTLDHSVGQASAGVRVTIGAVGPSFLFDRVHLVTMIGLQGEGANDGPFLWLRDCYDFDIIDPAIPINSNISLNFYMVYFENSKGIKWHRGFFSDTANRGGGFTAVYVDPNSNWIELDDVFAPRDTGAATSGIATRNISNKSTGKNVRITALEGASGVSSPPTKRVVVSDHIYARGDAQFIVKASDYVTIPHGARTTLAVMQDRLYFLPLWVARTITTTKIGAEVTTGAASSTCRLGVYRSDPYTGQPSSLLDEADNTIDGNSATAQEVDLAQTLDPGLWWLAVVAQGGTPTLRATAEPGYSLGSTGLGGAASIVGPIQAAVSAALPSPAALTSSVGTAPLVWIKVA